MGGIDAGAQAVGVAPDPGRGFEGIQARAGHEIDVGKRLGQIHGIIPVLFRDGVVIFRDFSVIAFRVDQGGLHQLFQVAKTIHSFGSFPCTVQRRQKHPRQDRNDRNDRNMITLKK